MESIKRLIKSKLQNLRNFLSGNLEAEIITNRMLLGKILINFQSKKEIKTLHEVEFSIFSQWGDDGIIQYLINHTSISNSIFIEFGVENYVESNTRFLLLNNNWRGLVFDGSSKHIKFIKSDSIYWKYDLTAKSAFITAENINDLILAEGISGDIGLLHIDIDGVDFWIWKALNVITPDIVIIEYNSVLGIKQPLTIEYKKDFVRSKAHYSNLYAGSSLLSLCDLADEKGYYFIGSNSAGNNAYFIRKSKINKLTPLSAEEGYIASKFREARDEEGNLSIVSGDERRKIIAHLPFFNTRTGKIEMINL